MFTNWGAAGAQVPKMMKTAMVALAAMALLLLPSTDAQKGKGNSNTVRISIHFRVL